MLRPEGRHRRGGDEGMEHVDAKTTTPPPAPQPRGPARSVVVIANLAAGLALGALLLGRGILVPSLDDSALVDANLAKALIGPLHLRLMEIAVAGTLIIATLAERWVRRPWATTVALLALGCAAVQRFFVLPKLYATWARTDLVAGRPVDRVTLAQQLQTQDLLMTTTIALLLIVLLVTSVPVTQRGDAFAPGARLAAPPQPT